MADTTVRQAKSQLFNLKMRLSFLEPLITEYDVNGNTVRTCLLKSTKTLSERIQGLSEVLDKRSKAQGLDSKLTGKLLRKYDQLKGDILEHIVTLSGWLKSKTKVEHEQHRRVQTEHRYEQPLIARKSEEGRGRSRERLPPIEGIRRGYRSRSSAPVGQDKYNKQSRLSEQRQRLGLMPSQRAAIQKRAREEELRLYGHQRKQHRGRDRSSQGGSHANRRTRSEKPRVGTHVALSRF